MSLADNVKAMKLVQGMQQFEEKHAAIELENGDLGCATCQTDWPCERMITMMNMQIIGQMQAMIMAKLEQLSGASSLMDLIGKGFGNA